MNPYSFEGSAAFKRRSWLYYLFLFLLFGFVFVLKTRAQEPTPKSPSDNEVNAIAKQMYCPVCENTPLDVCPTQACAEWRELIREKLAAGWSESQIKAYFVEQFGDRVLAEPPPRGINWLVYVVPPIAFIGGVYVLFRAFQAWKRPAAGNTGNQAEPLKNDDYVNRLEEELRKL
jgi:cytochrome c-type biogenesis protein CcmH